MEFVKLIEKRRSANNFLEGVVITEADLKPVFDDVKLAPSTFNLQHTNYYVVLDEEKKEQIRKAAFGQYKVHTAAGVIIVTANRYAYKDTACLNQGMLNLGIMTDSQLEQMVQENTNFYEQRGEDFMKEDAIRNGSLSAMMFMLAAKNRGLDTCPMNGFDPEKIRNILDIPSSDEIVLMITIGKEKESSRNLRGYRKPVEEFVTYMK